MLNRIQLIFGVICGIFLIFANTRDLETAEKDFVTEIIKEAPPAVPAKENQIVVAFDQGRGQLHRRRKVLKHLYPFLMAALLAKLIIVPLILKLLIAATSSAFVMSKVALVTSVIMALSWLLGATKEKTKFQIVPYSASGSNKVYGGWDVKYKPQYTSQYSDWTFDGSPSENNEKRIFL